MKPKSDSLPDRVSVCFCLDVCEGDVSATLTQMNYVHFLQRQCINYVGPSMWEILNLRERVRDSKKHSGKEKKYAPSLLCAN